MLSSVVLGSREHGMGVCDGGRGGFAVVWGTGESGRASAQRAPAQTVWSTARRGPRTFFFCVCVRFCFQCRSFDFLRFVP